jgi:hypothetical protein
MTASLPNRRSPGEVMRSILFSVLATLALAFAVFGALKSEPADGSARRLSLW